MKIAVIGTGYVGLVTGTCLAETGNNVICVDIDKEKIDKLNDKRLTIYERGLDILLERNINQKRLIFTTDTEFAVRNSDIVFLALPTPQESDGRADLRFVLEVADEIGEYIDAYKIIINKSTVPVGTSEKVKNKISLKCNYKFDVVSNPEFLKEGVAIEDFLKPERVVIGTSSIKAREILEKLYKPYVRQGNPIIFMDEKSAELTKYAANSILATKISFMNEIANICESVGANVDEVRKGIGSDSRIGKSFLFPGVGYGGSCFPKDVKALVEIAKENKYKFNILESVDSVNENQIILFYNKIKHFYKSELSGKKIAICGLSFKPNTDDIREAPALKLINKFLEEDVEINCYDPVAIENVKLKYGDKISYSNDIYECVNNMDALVIMTEWSMFRNIDFKKLKKNLQQPVIFDGRNLYDLKDITEEGFTYFSIGRKTIL